MSHSYYVWSRSDFCHRIETKRSRVDARDGADCLCGLTRFSTWVSEIYWFCSLYLFFPSGHYWLKIAAIVHHAPTCNIFLTISSRDMLFSSCYNRFYKFVVLISRRKHAFFHRSWKIWLGCRIKIPTCSAYGCNYCDLQADVVKYQTNHQALFF